MPAAIAGGIVESGVVSYTPPCASRKAAANQAITAAPPIHSTAALRSARAA